MPREPPANSTPASRSTRSWLAPRWLRCRGQRPSRCARRPFLSSESSFAEVVEVGSGLASSRSRWLAWLDVEPRPRQLQGRLTQPSRGMGTRSHSCKTASSPALISGRSGPTGTVAWWTRRSRMITTSRSRRNQRARRRAPPAAITSARIADSRPPAKPAIGVGFHRSTSTAHRHVSDARPPAVHISQAD